MTQEKKKKNSYKLKEKRQVLKELRSSNLSQRKFCETTGTDYNFLRGALEVEDDVLHLDSDDPVLDNYYLTKSVEQKHSQIDFYITEKLRKLREAGATINKHTILNLAHEYNNFMGSQTPITSHFLRTFKKRNKVLYRKIFGESKSADKSQLSDWFTIFENISKNYSEDDIFNFDETSLFMKAQNSHSYLFENDDRKGVKVDKTRITVGLCFNGKGDEICPMVIGKSANPRAFKNYDFSSLNLHYFSNKNAWCTRIYLHHI